MLETTTQFCFKIKKHPRKGFRTHEELIHVGFVDLSLLFLEDVTSENNMSPKRDYGTIGKCIFQPLTFSGHAMLVFAGVLFRLLVNSPLPTNLYCIYIYPSYILGAGWIVTSSFTCANIEQ